MFHILLNPYVHETINILYLSSGALVFLLFKYRALKSISFIFEKYMQGNASSFNCSKYGKIAKHIILENYSAYRGSWYTFVEHGKLKWSEILNCQIGKYWTNDVTACIHQLVYTSV